MNARIILSLALSSLVACNGNPDTDNGSDDTGESQDDTG